MELACNEKKDTIRKVAHIYHGVMFEAFRHVCGNTAHCDE